MSWEPTPEQQLVLNTQTFTEELLKIRAGKSEGPKDPPKSAWMRFLESTGGTAIITVVLGTLGGSIITGLVQSYNQRQQARQASISDYIKGEHETVKAAFDLIGQSIAASENLNAITSQAFNPATFPKGDQQSAVIAQKKAIRDDFNRADQSWRSTKETLSLNIRYYHGDNKDVTTAWDQTKQAVSAYMDCQDTWYTRHMGVFVDSQTAGNACAAQRGSLDAVITNLGDSLAKDRVWRWGT